MLKKSNTHTGYFGSDSIFFQNDFEFLNFPFFANAQTDDGKSAMEANAALLFIKLRRFIFMLVFLKSFAIRREKSAIVCAPHATWFGHVE